MTKSKDWSGNERSIFSTLGASSHADHERQTDDYYATEPIAVEHLMQLEHFAPDIWEPACGEGHISRVLQQHGYRVRSSDIVDRGFGEVGDFLRSTEPWHGDIVTNPPYKYAQEFVEHALEIIPDGHKVAMFLKLQFLEGKQRRRMYQITPPPTGVCVIVPSALRHEWPFRGYQCRGLRMVCVGQRLQGRPCHQMV